MESESIDEQREYLFEALADLEAALETPCVPGELERWIDAVEKSWQSVQPPLTLQIDRTHPQQYADIGEEDEELFRRVDRMLQEDAAIKAAAQQLGDEIPRLKTAAANVEPDEAKLRSAFDAFVERGLNLVIRIRTQEQAVRTWLMEAFTRDRGDAD